MYTRQQGFVAIESSVRYGLRMVATTLVASCFAFGWVLGGNAQEIRIPSNCTANLPSGEEAQYTNDEGVTFKVESVTAGTAFIEDYNLGPVDEGETWLLVELKVINESDDSINLVSHRFDVEVDGTAYSDNIAVTTEINKMLETVEMGDSFGTDIAAGEEEVFTLPYQVSASGDQYALVHDSDENLSITLTSFFKHCGPYREVEPAPTAAVTPTPSARVPSGTDSQTIEIMDDLERYQNTQITIRGEVYILDVINGQTAFVITDEETYFFNVVYDGDLPNVRPGDTVEVTGILLDRTVQGSPLVQASSVREI